MKLFSLCAALAVCLSSVAVAELPAPLVDNYYNIGKIHQQVSTDNREAQLWFDRGLAMCYGFNHEEAIRCFDKAVALDPQLAIAYAMKAYAMGPNFNNMEITRDTMLAADSVSKTSLEHLEQASPLERMVIEAIDKRSGESVPEDFDQRGPFNQAYADAMAKAYAEHGDSPFVAELYAESLMNLQPWKHWSVDGKPGEQTPTIVEVIERGLAAQPNHAGLCHMYVHVMEASPTPGKALPAANRLRTAVPGSGHLVHMPTHIDVLVGDYASVVKSNSEAIEVDKVFLDREGPLNFFSLYRLHNYHFLVYGAMFDGQSQQALAAARAINQQVPEEMLKEQVDFLDAFMPTTFHVMVRFGRWDDILNEPTPPEYLPMSRAVRLYARTLAYAATERVEQAEAEQQKFLEAVKLVPESSLLFQNTSLDILGIAEAMVAGEIAYRKGEYDQAFAHLREAVRRDDALNYDEPWGWMQPARHALGALLLEQGHYAESEAVYREDLARHPKNPWALHGLVESLVKQGKEREAAQYVDDLEASCQRADVTINRSCYCRLKVLDE
ncbi:tetratricopeptide repeat protein [Aeoliella mucimassa]|uniref:Tetratricopeptide repeat protein n=1 Tax=Aeoliella mucimassa TaxID=2527972 RepID=A0A518AWE8_9BACT|nr:tetratricopeptide repeat protein [Aeoliella mucimassa]QDU59059.1 Tetratricopeptide repeat protein [Aeoliella mucimassa]